MEKSMVQELSSLTHSSIFSTRPSLIFPTDLDRMELRRSRIQNLPGYRKEDLSSKLNFVVVFQTIEIERLTVEIETLRVKARDWDRQRQNYQSYEVQIRELTERCHSNEMQKQGLEDELQRLREFCEKLLVQVQQSRTKSKQYEPGLKQKYQLQRARNQQLQGEVDRWRNRYSSLEISRTKELQELRMQFESRRKSQINRQTREIAIKHENQLTAINSELRKARQQSQLRFMQMHRLEQIINKFNLREEQMKEIQQKMYEYENKFVLLSQQNYRLNELLRWKSEQIQKMKRIQRQLRSRIQSNNSYQQVISKLQTQLEKRTISLVDVQKKLQLSNESNNILSAQCQKMNNYEGIVNQLQVELRRMNQVLREKLKQIQDLRTSNKILENKSMAANSATQKQFAAYEEKIISFTRDQQRYNAQLKHRLSQNEQLKVKCSELQRQLGSIGSLRQENERLKVQIGQYSAKIEDFKRKILLLEENLHLMDDLQSKMKKQEQIKRQLLSQRQKLNASVRQLTLMYETSNQRVQVVQGQLVRLSNADKQLSGFKQQLVWMTQQLDRINGELQLRTSQLQQIRQSLKMFNNNKINNQSIQTRLVENLAQMEKLILDLDLTRRENDRLINDNMNFEMHVRSQQGEIMKLIEQRDSKADTFKAQQQQILALRQKVQYYTSQLRVKQQLQKNFQEINKKYESFKAMYTQMEERLNKQTARSEQLISQNMQLRSTPKISKQYLQQLTTVKIHCQNQGSTIYTLIQRIQTLHKIIIKMKQHYQRNFNSMNQIKDQAFTILYHADFIDKVFEYFEGFSEKMESLREMNLKLESDRALSGIQYCQSMKIVQEGPKEGNILMQNSSIAARISAQDLGMKSSSSAGNLFTFKDMRKEVISREGNQALEKPQDQSIIRQSYLEDPKSQQSMASSFINTLLTKESTARFQNRIAEGSQNPAFGYNITQKIRYSPYEGGDIRSQKDDVMYVDSQIQNVPMQMNRVNSPTNRVVMLQNAGIKRVTSYTHFGQNYFSQLSAPQQNVSYVRDSTPPPTIRLHQINRSPNTASFTPESSQLGKRIRIPADPARLAAYRPQ